MKWFSVKNLLFFILLLALGLRLVGTTYGLPHFFVGDEQSQLGASLVMLKEFNLVPGTIPESFNLLYYPPVMSYVYLLPLLPVLLVWMFVSSLSPSELAVQVVLDPTIPWIAGRVLVVLIGTATVYLTYILAGRIFNKKAGLFAAFFLATSFLHISLSHFTRHWVPSLFFATLVMISAYNLWKYGRLKDYLWSAVFVGLSFGVGFIGIVSAFFPVLAHFARVGFIRGLKSKSFWSFILLLSVIVAAIIALYPQRFLEISQGTDISVSEQKSIQGFIASFGFHLKTLILSDPVLAVLALFGVIFGIFRKNKFIWIFLTYGFLYISALYFVIHNEPRYISFLYSGLVILAALPAVFFWEKFRGQAFFAKTVSGLLLVIFLFYPLLVSAQFVKLLTRDDTRIAAQKWIETNLPQETRILSFFKPEVLTPSKQVIQLQAELAPDSLRTKERILLNIPEEQYPKSFEVLSFPKVMKRDGFEPEYAALQYWNLSDYLKIPAYVKAGQDPVVFDSGLEGAGIDYLGNFDASTFLLFKMERLGPTIEIHRLE